MEYFFKTLNLKLFDGEGAGAAGADAGGAVAGGDQGAPEAPVNPKRLKRNPLADVKYGIQEESAPGDASTQSNGTEPAAASDPDEEWKSIREKYKDQYGRDVQNAIQDRFKNSRNSDAALDKLQPALDALIKMRGLKEGDYDALVNNILDDDSLYEDEAMERGVSIDTMRQIKQLERDNEQMRQREQQSFEQQQFAAHIQLLATQGERLKEIYPNFDLRTELQNPTFARLTQPGSGIDVQTAFEVVHHGEIQAATNEAIAQQTRQQLANSIASKARRPVEAGAKSQAAVDIRPDPKAWSKADRAEVRRRVAAGEKIIL